VGGTNVYVTNLPLTITLKAFRQLLLPFGSIIAARLVPRRKGHPPVGFVQFTASDSAARAVAAMDGREVSGVKLCVTLARRDKDKGVQSRPSPSLYVANLPQKLTEADVHALFSKFGAVQAVRLLRFPDTGASKGVAIVRYSTVEQAERAKGALHCAPLLPYGAPLEVKFAESKEERLSRLDPSTSSASSSRPQGDLHRPPSPSPSTPLPDIPPPNPEDESAWSTLPDTGADGWSWLEDPPNNPTAGGLSAPPTPWALPITSPLSCSSIENSSVGYGDAATPLLPVATPKEPTHTGPDPELAAHLEKLAELAGLLALGPGNATP
jgi:hypothetical protein